MKTNKTLLQEEILNSLPYRPIGRLLLSPRLGKTKLVIDLIKRDKPKTILWVTPEATLAMKDIPDEFEDWGATKYLDCLYTSTWASLNKIKGNFDLIVLDEDHKITVNNAKNLLDNTLTYNSIISMSGTPTKHYSKLDIFTVLGLETLYEVTINDAVDMELLAYYKINVIHVPLSKVVDLQESNFMTSEYKLYNYLNKRVNDGLTYGCNNLKYRILARMRAIKDNKSKEKAAYYLINSLKGRKIFYCASIKQAEKLSPNTFHSKTDDKDLIRFKNNEIDTITMVNAGGVGHTYKDINHLVMVQADSDKNGAASQKLCRALLRYNDNIPNIWVICLDGTQDELWVTSFLDRFDKNKIEHINFKDLKL